MHISVTNLLKNPVNNIKLPSEAYKFLNYLQVIHKCGFFIFLQSDSINLFNKINGKNEKE